MTSPILVPSNDALLPNRKLWTVDECDQLERHGFLPRRYELLNGQIAIKTGHCTRHALPITAITFIMLDIVGKDRVLMHLSHIPRRADRKYNLPEVDIAVYRSSARDFHTPLPFLTDVLLVVEVSDTTLDAFGSTLDTDLGLKAALYARSSVPEYWVLDAIGRRLFVHQFPVKNKYSNITIFEEHESVVPMFAPDANPLLVSDFLVPASSSK